jgi:hypothetical protein
MVERAKHKEATLRGFLSGARLPYVAAPDEETNGANV